MNSNQLLPCYFLLSWLLYAAMALTILQIFHGHDPVLCLISGHESKNVIKLRQFTMRNYSSYFLRGCG